MADKKDKKTSKINPISISEDLIKHLEYIEKSEVKEWERITTQIEEKKTNSERIAYLYRELSDYYIKGITPYKTVISGTFLNQFPNSNNLFLDRKINAEIEYYKNIKKLELKEFVFEEEGKVELEELEKKYGRYKRRFTFLKELGFFESKSWSSYGRNKQNIILSEIIGCSNDYAKKLINTNAAGMNNPYGNDEKHGITEDVQKEVKEILKD